FEWRRDYLTAYEDVPAGMSGVTDLGRALLSAMEHSGRGAGYVAIAVLFFIGYWVIAGPGSYFFLAARRKAHFSWLAFGACALVATALTAGIVKLVLRGPPEVRHVTLVRVGPDGHAVAWSNVGLYIPR